MKRLKSGKKELYLPDSGGNMKMGSGGVVSQGGLGTKDVINDKVVVGGLEHIKRSTTIIEKEKVEMEVEEETVVVQVSERKVENEDERALRELRAGDTIQEAEEIQAILPAAADNRLKPLDEASAFRRDVETRPDEVSPLSPPLPPLTRILTLTLPPTTVIIRRLCSNSSRTIRFSPVERNGLERRNFHF